jgi:hypothetical protein
MGGVVILNIHVMAGGYANRLPHCVVHLPPPGVNRDSSCQDFFLRVGGCGHRREREALLART